MESKIIEIIQNEIDGNDRFETNFKPISSNDLDDIKDLLKFGSE